jgi:3'-phosphoadenosine 5'-phosphosulfate (PAPS) 3'-phosphatase
VWIVDPLDWHPRVREAGRSDWAVHAALAVCRGDLVAGAVALPPRDVLLAT